MARPVLPLFAVLAAAGWCLTGCTTSTYEVKVDAISKPDVATASHDPQSYVVKSKDPRLGDENLRYKEAADYVRTALSGKGLYEAPNADSADVVVELDYGMATPRTKLEQVSVPVYAQVGGGVRYDTVPVTDSRGNVSYRTVAVYDPPSSTLVGYDNMTRPVTIYEKYLRVTATENKPGVEGKPPAQIWSVAVSTEDESKDLRKYLPILASATADYIGRDTVHEQVVKVHDPSPGTDFIRRGMGDAASATTSSAAAPKS